VNPRALDFARHALCLHTHDERYVRLMPHTPIKAKAKNVLTHPVRWVCFRLVRLVWPKESVDGLEVIDAMQSDGGSRSERIARVRAALELIGAACDSNRRRVHDHLRCIIIAETGPHFSPDNRMCVLNVRHIERLSTERIALQIVHEATHALLWARGFDYEPEIRQRIEHVCIHAEARFAKHLPDGAVLKAETLAKLNAVPWWTDAAISGRLETDLALSPGGSRFLAWLRQ
jgi:hypothetical protein